jgi:multiple sugar transport system substrate-binding protein
MTPAAPATLVFSGSAVGTEGALFDKQLAAFEGQNPQWRVIRHPTPDAADQRHHLYVQWLNAGARTPDVLQLDVVWTPEFAAAGWIRPLDELENEAGDFFPQVLRADRLDGRLYALPLFVDVGMLYYRRDLVAQPPRDLDQLRDRALELVRSGRTRYGFVWQGARYEGLVTVFLEHLTAFGGRILDENGSVRVDEPAGLRALEFMRDSVRSGLVPQAALAWQEEAVRFAFQNGEAVFMRNWPYAYPLLGDSSRSPVAGQVAVAALPAGPGGQPAAALGGARLAVNARSAHPTAALALVRFLTAPEQVLQRAQLAGQYPARRSLYQDERLARALAVPLADVRAIVERAVPRPVTPLYAELSAALQVQLHAALTEQKAPAAALAEAAAHMRAVLAQATARPPGRASAGRLPWMLLLAVVVGGAVTFVWIRKRRREPAPPPPERSDRALALTLLAPALVVIAAVGLAPLLWTVWESLHRHDLRLPALGRPFVGLANYGDLLGSDRFWSALAHTAAFAAITVAAEIVLGMVLALALHQVTRGRGFLRTTVLLPWALPTVVAALVWQFMFADVGVVNRMLVQTGLTSAGPAWFSHSTLAWIPLLLADVWKTTPFVALLLLAGLQSIDERLYEAARTDGAGRMSQFLHITLPLLRPALLVVLVFRSLDAFRVFDLVYVLTGGGPGTATEPVALYTFASLMQHLRFGYGSALSVVVFVLAFSLALAYTRLLSGAGEDSRS